MGYLELFNEHSNKKHAHLAHGEIHLQSPFSIAILVHQSGNFCLSLSFAFEHFQHVYFFLKLKLEQLRQFYVHGVTIRSFG